MKKMASSKKRDRHPIIRLRIVVRGAVQGVGFRPFVYRLAGRFGLPGWVNNAPDGVYIEVEGEEKRLRAFLHTLSMERPPLSSIQAIETSWLEPLGFESFEIRESEEKKKRSVLILPDIATCHDCQREVFDRKDRRFRYPFTNCTNCGPRFTIIEGLPYDRQKTTMKVFKMCSNCSREYQDPGDRRFHAQPNACPLCGPRVELLNEEGVKMDADDRAIRETVRALKSGKIVGVKGLGGFHLMVDPFNRESLQELRKRKPRRDKPYALMFPNIEAVREHCQLSPEEERELLSPVAPILLLKRKEESKIEDLVAPKNPFLGVMLPYTPLHHILLHDLGQPIVATSGNLSDEPIIIDEKIALSRLKGIADLFLVHTRPIKRHSDDSIARVFMRRTMVLRRARGLAPFPIKVREKLPRVLAMGGQLKNTFALAVGDNIFLSQHIGDLETRESLRVFLKEIQDFESLYDFRPEILACDMHPRYLSTQVAMERSEKEGIPLIKVQHHHAHVASSMAENDLTGKVLGVSWDGTGYGEDGTIWGGEFLLCDYSDYERVAHLRTFPLPGGDRAIKEPRRVALGILYEIFRDGALEDTVEPHGSFTKQERGVLIATIRKGINTPLTSSAGRLFDAVSSILGLRQRITFEGQAAMELEFCASSSKKGMAFPFEIKDSHPLVVDWEPILLSLIEEKKKGKPLEELAFRFHLTLAHIILEVAQRISNPRVVLSGGVFQNVLLSELTHELLLRQGFKVYIHQRVPPNDGGISLGQAMVAGARFKST